MALTKCKECGYEIAKSAKACPKCGAVVKRTGCFTMGLAVFFGIVLLSVIITAVRNTPAPDSNTTQAHAPTLRSAVDAPMSGNPAHDQIMQLSNSERNTLFTKYIASEPCGTVTRNFLQGVSPDGSTKGKAFWSIACSNGSSYMVTIEPDAAGSSSITDCAVLKLVDVECFKKL